MFVAEKVAARPHLGDHVQGKGLRPEVDPFGQDAHPVIHVGVEDQLFRVEQGARLHQAHAASGLGAAQCAQHQGRWSLGGGLPARGESVGAET